MGNICSIINRFFGCTDNHEYIITSNNQIRIDNFIDSGGYTNIYKCTINRKTFAIKILKLNNSNAIKDLYNEFQLLTELNHPNIVKVYNNDYYNDKKYIILDFIDGNNLCNTIISGYFISPEIKYNIIKIIFIQLIDALKYLHLNYICHRDIKPDNIIFNKKTNKITLVDFGFSCKTDKLMFIDCGTPNYIAPEVWNNINGYNHSVDIWASGLVLFTLIFCQLPFTEYDDIFKLKNEIINLNIDIYLISVNKHLAHLLNNMLQLDPNNRISLDEIQIHKWLQ